MRSNSGRPKKRATRFPPADRIKLSCLFGKSCPVMVSLVACKSQTAAFVSYLRRIAWHGPWKDLRSWMVRERRVSDEEGL